MRVVADTNTVISGLLWHGPPRQVLDKARDGSIELIASAQLLAELEDVLHREKFRQRLGATGVSARDLVMGYAALAALVKPEAIDPVVQDDPEDDQVLACALAAKVDIVVSGDHHLLQLGEYQGIAILTPAQVLDGLTVDES